MGTSIQPVFYTTKETENYIDHLSADIKNTIGKDADLLLDHPGIYIHVWRSKYDFLNGTYSIYIGETNDIVQRTKEHWSAAQIPKSKRSKGNWQYHMLEDVDEKGKQVIPTVYFFGHEYFHKSITLDIENRLIDYCYAMESAHVYNGRTNPQGYYSGDDNLDDIFSMIWKILRKENPNLFLSESAIQKSAIYKASPNHKLTEEQKEAKTIIIDRTVDAVLHNKQGQLIFIEGEAGTGKTVLTSSTFYEILENEFLQELKLNCFMLINHAEQKLVYQNMARKLGYSEDIIQNPTGFLKKHSILNTDSNSFEPDGSNMADIVFVDEAHLLWNQRNQAYDRRFVYPQLDEIIRRSRVTVIMFDENQMLHRGQFFSMEYIEKKRNLAKSQGPDSSGDKSNYFVLKNQLRMNCSVQTMRWIDNLSKTSLITDLALSKKGNDEKGYEVKIFDDPEMMHQSIRDKAKKEDSQLSRMVATCDWEYKNSSAPENSWYWNINIGSWEIPWNEEIFWRDLYYDLNKREIKRYKMMDWAEKPYSINEAGSTFTVQGFDLSYVGVILGPSVRYDVEKKKIWFDKKYRAQNYMTGKRILEDGTQIDVTNIISRHELRVLMTRGTKGLYIYACDDDLRKALKDAVKYN